MKNYHFILGAFLALTSVLHASSPIQVKHLTCEQCVNPLGIDQVAPQLSWQLSSPQRNQYQKAYEIMVGTDSVKLINDRAIVWKSGRVESDETLFIRYQGKKLRPFTKYYWKVRVINQHNDVSDWSEIASWETAMLTEDDWKSQWIFDGSSAIVNEDDYYENHPAPLYRRNFTVNAEIEKARLYIAGIGYYEACMNGKRIGDHVLDPGWTNYDKQILYSTYDVTDLVANGENTLGVVLGNGFYNPQPMPIFQKLRDYLTIGQPCLKAQLQITYKNGKKQVVCSDSNWKFTEGPIVRNNVYLGEHYDARKEIEDWNLPSFDDRAWQPVECVVNPPKGRLTAQLQPPIRVREIIKPTRMTETRKGEFVFDMGQNFAGVARIKVKGPKGTCITLRYGEDVYSDGSLNVMTSVAGQHKQVWNADRTAKGAPQTAWQEDSYILKGEGEEIWTPSFTFHGFRYVEITGWPGRPTLDDIEGIRLCSDLENNGSFSSSNTMLNTLHKVMDYTFLSNVFSVESDCPAREKFGYGGDIVGVSRTFCYFYDMRNFYTKAIQDFANDQRPLGGFTETAPFNGIQSDGLGDNSGPIGWQLAYGFLQKQLYEYYGDFQIIESGYPALKKQVDFLASKAKDYIIDRCINDHESLDERIPALFATAHFYHHCLLLTEFAELTKRTDDAKRYESLKEHVKEAFIKRFVDQHQGVIGNGTPAEQAFGLYYNLIPEGLKEKVFDNLLLSLKEREYHITSGIFGTPLVLTVLSDMNRNDIAYRIVNQKTFPGWGYMIQSGATTLWETWKYSDNVYSQNHPMFGSVGEWMYQSLGGIKAMAPGFKEISIHPQPVGDLKWNNCTYRSVRGDITSNWKIENNTYTLQVCIPANTKAAVFLPALPQQILEGGKSLTSVKGLKIISMNGLSCCVEIPSGSYEFRCEQ